MIDINALLNGDIIEIVKCIGIIAAAIVGCGLVIKKVMKNKKINISNRISISGERNSIKDTNLGIIINNKSGDKAKDGKKDK